MGSGYTLMRPAELNGGTCVTIHGGNLRPSLIMKLKLHK